VVGRDSENKTKMQRNASNHPKISQKASYSKSSYSQQVQKAGKSSKKNQGHTTWLHSLAEPCKFLGRRIPDANCRESTPLHLVSSGTFPTATATGITGGILCYGSLLSSQSLINTATATAAVLTWNAAVSDPRLTDVTNDYVGVRLVSATIYWEMSTKYLDAQGTCRMVSIQDETGITTAQGLYPSVASMDLAKFRKKMSLTEETRSNVLWAGHSQAGSMDYYQPSTVLGTADAITQEGCLAIVFTGLTTGTVIDYTIVRNYEAVPVAAKRHLIPATPSAHDPYDMALTMSHAGRMPKFDTLGPKDIAKSMSQPMVQAPNNPSIFAQIASGIDTVAGIADSVIKSPLGQLAGDFFSKLF